MLSKNIMTSISLRSGEYGGFSVQEEHMALTDNPNTKHRKPKDRSITAKTNRSWSDKQKMEAIQHYLLVGNLALTSRVLGIPEITLRQWKTMEWWKNSVEDIKLQENMEMSARLKKMVEASLIAVTDRLENGDWMYDQKTGQMIRKPVNIRDAHKVATDLMDKRTMLEKAAAPAQEQVQDVDRLEQLAEKFASFVMKKTEQPPVIVDVTDVTVKDTTDALHEGREEGLREGVRPVPQPSEAASQPISEDNPTETGQ
jgi:transposase-like protein